MIQIQSLKIHSVKSTLCFPVITARCVFGASSCRIVFEHVELGDRELLGMLGRELCSALLLIVPEYFIYQP